MPEGPEIRREADRIARVLKGQRARSVWFAFDHLRSWSRRMRGRVIHTVEPRGKALLIRLGGNLNIDSHNQLYGRWPRREYRHWVFGRAGKRCRACRVTIQKLAHSGRRIYLCHACQGKVAS